MVNIKYAPDGKGLHQAYSYGTLFALASSKNEQIMPFVFCADYFNEVFGSVVTQERKSVYGFSYDATKDLLPDDKYTRVLITHDKIELPSLVVSATKFLNEFEERIGLKRSKMSLCNSHPKYKKNVLLVKGDKRVRNSVLLLTAWRVILRNSFAANPNLSLDENLQKMTNGKFCFFENDCGAIEKLISFLEYLVKYDKDFINYTDTANFKQQVYTIHNDSGLTVFSTIFKQKKEYLGTPWEKRIVEKMS
jgi:hypothetical protein